MRGEEEFVDEAGEEIAMRGTGGGPERGGDPASGGADRASRTDGADRADDEADDRTVVVAFPDEADDEVEDRTIVVAFPHDADEIDADEIDGDGDGGEVDGRTVAVASTEDADDVDDRTVVVALTDGDGESDEDIDGRVDEADDVDDRTVVVPLADESDDEIAAEPVDEADDERPGPDIADHTVVVTFDDADPEAGSAENAGDADPDEDIDVDELTVIVPVQDARRSGLDELTVIAPLAVPGTPAGDGRGASAGRPDAWRERSAETGTGAGADSGSGGPAGTGSDADALDEHTVIVPRSELAVEDATVVVSFDRTATGLDPEPEERPRAAQHEPLESSWSAPSAPGVAGEPVVEPPEEPWNRIRAVAERQVPRVYGARSTESAVPLGTDEVHRALGAPPAADPMLQPDFPAARPPLPSLLRRSRRGRIMTVAGYAAALVISVCGLWVVARIAFG